MFLFTPFVVNAEMRFKYGISFSVVVSLIMCINIAYAVYGTISDSRRKKKLNGLKSAYESRVEKAK
jgi:hypothetical protein